MSDQSTKITALKEIADAIVERGDLVEICQLARETVETVIPCEQVTIVRNDDELQRFIITPALNQGTRFERSYLQLSYDDCSWRSILEARSPHETRPSLVTGGLSKNEQELAGQEAIVCLAVPIHLRCRTFGVIHIVCNEDRSFDSGELVDVEEIATLLALAFERARIYASNEALEESASLWRGKYSELFESVEQAAVVVDGEADAIYEANRSAALLTGYDREHLHGMPFSSLFPEGRVPEITRIAGEGRGDEGSPGVAATLLRGDDTEITVTVSATQMTLAGRLRFLVLLSQRQPEPADTKTTEATQPDVTPLSWSDSLDPYRFEESLDALVSQVGRKLEAKYGTVHAVDETRRRLRMVRSVRVAEERQSDINNLDVWLADGPYKVVYKSDKLMECPSVSDSPEFAHLRPAAQRAGYAGFLSAPLQVGGKKLGTLTFFFEKQAGFSAEQKRLLQQDVQQVAVLVLFSRTRSGLEKRANRNKAALEVATAVVGIYEVEEVVARTAEAMRKHVGFDMLSVTLFDDQPQKLRILCLTSHELAGLLRPAYGWNRIDDSDLGWLEFKVQNSGVEGSPHDDASIHKKLGSKISVLLLVRNKYLGNLALGSIGENAFNDENVELLRTLAPAFSSALDNALIIAESKAEPAFDQTVRAGEPRPERDLQRQSWGAGEEGSDRDIDGSDLEERFQALHNLRSYVQAVAEEAKVVVASMQESAETAIEEHAGAPESEDRQRLARVKAKISELDHLVSDLSEITSLYAEGDVRRPTSVQKIVNEATVVFHKVCDEQNIQLVVRPGAPMVLNCDPGRMTFAVRFMLEVASRHLVGVDRPRIEIGHRETVLDNFIFIKYNGPTPHIEEGRITQGVPSEEKTRDLSSFDHGLQMAQSIIQDYDGRWWAESKPDGDTEFLILIPKSRDIGSG